MGILDEAIREHLELKRQHGAADSELQQLESEAFGPAARPGERTGDAALAEAPPTDEGEAPTTVQPSTEAVAPLQPEAPPEPSAPQAPEEPAAPVPPEGPDEEEQPAVEHRIVEPGAAEDTVRAETEEHPPPEPPEALPRQEEAEEPEADSIAGQPTELYDVESEQVPEEEEVGEEAEVDEEAQGGGEEAEDEFFSEQSLSDELDQALDAPEGEPAGEEDGEDVAEEEGEDVLEETPEFLQDTPEHDRLWFEQKPPKDFDFDD